MVTRQLISPRSIAVIGGSDDLHKPGGTTLNNLISTANNVARALQRLATLATLVFRPSSKEITIILFKG